MFFRTAFEIERMYTKKFTLLRVRPVMINMVMPVVANSLISIHLTRNPANGGIPAKFAIIKIRSHFSFLVDVVELIFFCFEFFKNSTTSRTELQ